ncbi:hypothetical protein DWB68_02810 [Galactobacter valiniphilus]|uniref:Alkaline shock response membrane anchor protein AmaP n=1 Tax=Galactobacter valiniphilus TaxID=2676122 RepID=A0A399JCH9_9MICC|nr:DUF6286 domain-containing protein [Galactobacter valiniphilus]RII43255.1 hypothetical protein DWB68_02810 [Galactobacter valiniphilus]
MSKPRPDLESINARVRRRELRTGRSGLVVTVVTLLVLLLGYLGLEAGTRAVDHKPWLIKPDAAWAWFVGLPDTAQVRIGVIVGGVLLLLLGLGLLYAALAPGRRPVRELPARRVIALVEHDVLAQALVRGAQLAAGVGAEQVRVGVDGRGVHVSIRPTSGVPVDAEAVRAAVAADLERNGLDPATPVAVQLAATGVVGQ